MSLEMNTPHSDPPALGRTAAFLSEYASWLLGSGATCIRLEKNISRMARTFGANVEMTIMPRHIHLSFTNPGGCECITSIASPKKIPIDFTINTRLSELSWQVADGKVSFAEMEKEFRKAIRPAQSHIWLVTLLVSLANASFCRLFGGDLMAMAVVGVATFAGFWLKRRLTALGTDLRITVFACALLSSILGASGMLFSLGTTPAVALGTSVLYLVPGIPFLNSFSDLIYRHYICAFSRFTDAVVITCCLSAGLCAGMALMNAGMF